jgi:hypothetical protein
VSLGHANTVGHSLATCTTCKPLQSKDHQVSCDYWACPMAHQDRDNRHFHSHSLSFSLSLSLCLSACVLLGITPKASHKLSTYSTPEHIPGLRKYLNRQKECTEGSVAGRQLSPSCPALCPALHTKQHSSKESSSAELACLSHSAALQGTGWGGSTRSVWLQGHPIITPLDNPEPETCHSSYQQGAPWPHSTLQ